MKMKRLLALILTVTLTCSVIVFTSPAPAAVAEAGTAVLNPTDDAFVSFENGKENANFGGDTTLQSGYNNIAAPPAETGYTDKEGHTDRGALGYPRDVLMKFDLGEIDPSSVTSAKLSLTIAAPKNLGTNQNYFVTSTTIGVYAADDNWTQDKVTRNNAPAAGKLAGISQPLYSSSAKAGTVVEIDVTSYIRQNPRQTYSFKIMPAAGGFDFHSNEADDASLRPALSLSYDSQLSGAVTERAPLTADTYADSADAARSQNFSSSQEMIIAADKTTGGENGALSARNGFISVKLPEGGAKNHFDSVKIVLRGKEQANSAHTVSLVPLSASFDAAALKWSNQPALSAKAVAAADIPNDTLAVNLGFFTFDITDYVNANPSENGEYYFGLTANTALSRYYTLENPNELYRPYVEYTYRDNATLTVAYQDESGTEFAESEVFTLPAGQLFTPEISAQMGEYIYSSSETEKKNTFPYEIKSGENSIVLVYAKKSITGVEEISRETIQYVAPELPETINVFFSDGSSEYYPVSWSDIDETRCAEAGEFTVMGTILGLNAEAVSASVKVLGVTGLELPTLTTAPGFYPSLPSQVTVNIEDGSQRKMSVIWNEIDPASYAELGSLNVSGNLQPGGMPVQIIVLVEDGDVDDREALGDAYIQLNEPNSRHNGMDVRISGSDAKTQRKALFCFEGGGFGDDITYDDRGENGQTVNAIVNASIRLFFQSMDNDYTATFSIYGISSDWNETSVTWSSSESLVENAELIVSKQVVQKNFKPESWIDFDVTGYVRDHRDSEYLAFLVEADHCASVITSSEAAVGGRSGQSPTLRITNYIKDSPVSLHYMADGTDIATPTELVGKLGKPFTYEGSVPDMIFCPEPERDSEGNLLENIDPSTIYYYDFVNSPTPPQEGEKDPALSLDSLDAEDNIIIAHYTQRMIKNIEPVTDADGESIKTWRGVRPRLPETVTAYLDNGAAVTKNVKWRWEDVPFTEYAARGSFTLYGDVEHAPDDVKASAEITVYEATYGENESPSENRLGLTPGTTYRLTFTAGADVPAAYASDIEVVNGEDRIPAYSLMGEMTEQEFMSYLGGFAKGDEVEIFFTAPEADSEGPGLELTLPDSLEYILNPRLSVVEGRGAAMTLHYIYNDEELTATTINMPFGSEFALTEDEFTVLDGAYIVTGVASHSGNSISGLTDTVLMNTESKDVYLSCSYVPAFTLDASVENVMNSDGVPYARSRAVIFNGTEEERGAEVVVAQYDENGKLSSISREQVNPQPGSETPIVIEKAFPIDENRHTAIFVWNNSLVPYISKVDSRNPSGSNPHPETGDLIIIPALERSITASNEQEGNEAVHLLDREGSTRWSAQVGVKDGEEIPAVADIDLGGLYDLHTIGLAFYKGGSRRTDFAISVSEDGENYFEVIPRRTSSGKSASTEYYSFDTIPTRYVRIDGYGWKAKQITDEGLVDVSDNWFSATAFEAYGPVSAFAETIVGENEDFDAIASPSAADWSSAALNEMTYTDYTPQTGSELFANIASTPKGVGFADGNTALHLYDNVDRDDKGTGAGSIGAFHKLALPSESYRISFKWYVPNVIDGSNYNAQWSGVTLSSGRVAGGADTSHPAALQLRLAPSGQNKMGFNIMRSITYNEGDQASLLGSTSAFKSNCVWDVMLDVDSASNSVVVTVSDGEKTESAFVRYGLYNAERTMSQTWSNSAVNYIMFNTGAGGKCEMYIDDFSVISYSRDSEYEGEILKEYDFNDFDTGVKITSEVDGISSALINEDNFPDYTPDYGGKLYVDVASSSKTDGALHLYDSVGRDNGGSNGSGGVFAYVDLDDFLTKNLTKLTFDMYAPTAGEWGGFALANGHNTGGADKTHPLALQARFSPQEEGMQFNMNTSIQYNKGDNNALVGTGNSRLGYNKLWKIEVIVNPVLGNMTVKASDGSLVSTNTVSIPIEGNDGWTVDWSKTPINTLIINTGAGGSGEIFIDNITVADMGAASASLPAVNGIIRLQNAYDIENKGQSYFVVNANTVNSTLGVTNGVNPFYTRFVERKGLYDPNGVSFELIGQPGCYVVVEGSNNNIRVRRYVDTDDFRKRATFNKVKKVGKNGDYSYEIYREPGRYLRVNGTSVETKDNKSNFDDGMKLACSFYLRDESKNYVSDSFNGSSLSGQWYKGYPWYSNYHNHSAIHRNENVVVGGGRVLLKATKVASDDWIKNSSGQTGYNDSINGGKWKKYCAWTGVISVNSKTYNKGSYIEGSFKQPNSPVGYWTAFWLNGRDSWPPETDMFEYLSSKGTNTWYTATHGGSEGAGWMSNGSVGNMRTQWNTFSIDWGYNYIDMYVNGNLYFSRRGTSDVPVQKNMYLILNTGIGAWETEPNSSTVWNTGLECQWLRSYQYY